MIEKSKDLNTLRAGVRYIRT